MKRYTVIVLAAAVVVALIGCAATTHRVTADKNAHGIRPDSVVYDAAAWSCIIETSVRSVATGSMPVNIPDFTRGLWKTIQPLGTAEKA